MAERQRYHSAIGRLLRVSNNPISAIGQVIMWAMEMCY